MTECPLEISCQDLQQQLARGERPLLVDCREPEEHAIVAIPGAKLLPMSQWSERRHELEGRREQSIVVVCHLGVRSQQVAAWLREQGYSSAQSLAGGIDAWAVEIEPGMTRY